MTGTYDASSIQVGDQIRNENQPPFPGPFSTVLERESFKRGTRIWVRLEDGSEHTFCAATSLIINKSRFTDPAPNAFQRRANLANVRAYLAHNS